MVKAIKAYGPSESIAKQSFESSSPIRVESVVADQRVQAHT
jgi:hypothetical protein